jgi:REP element-mobilizing transposase RayT
MWKLPTYSGKSIWQRNYYEHIIRDEEEHQRIFLYIQTNLASWAADNDSPPKHLV